MIPLFYDSSFLALGSPKPAFVKTVSSISTCSLVPSFFLMTPCLIRVLQELMTLLANNTVCKSPPISDIKDFLPSGLSSLKLVSRYVLRA